MLLLQVLLAVSALCCRCGSAQVLKQTPISITKPESKTVLINCHVSNPDFNNVFIHWYRKRPNAAPKRIAYMSSRLFLENKSDEGKYSIEKDLRKSVCTLTGSVTPFYLNITHLLPGEPLRMLPKRVISFPQLQPPALPGELSPSSRRQTPARALGMLLLPLLALAAAWSHGQAEVLLKQSHASVTRVQATTARIDCTVEGVPSLQSAIIHWYQHIPSEAPKRILYISSGQVSYDDESYRSKYALKQRANVFTLTVDDINSSDEGGDAQAVPVQTPKLQRQVKGSSAKMECRMPAENTVHWYKQLPGEPPKRILYVSGRSPSFDDTSIARRFQVGKHPTQALYSLTIDFLTTRDSGTYYCAYWVYQRVTALDVQR
ncbi:hypothetical protein QYF61_014382 [Mycteria americana]|uniref:Ig-like domain-containing protein n=1 Tax=Mycteria americana TaxID=33587 RepID=A0AAN7RZW8_MYCAM|nr:hypothetical protein QYF61_014382 [Mycteria americana]